MDRKKRAWRGSTPTRFLALDRSDKQRTAEVVDREGDEAAN